MSAEKRSALMARIRGKNTKPEVLLRKYLWRAGFRYRLHPSNLAGKPDLGLPRWNALVFVNGCFWHAHEGCPYFRLPANRAEFWKAKLSGNRQRDRAILARLSKDGWRIAVVWECALRADADATGASVADWLKRGVSDIELEGSDHRVLKRPSPAAPELPR